MNPIHLTTAFLTTLLFTMIPGTSMSAPVNLSPLAGVPDWSELDAYQGSITQEEFRRWLDALYAPGGAWQETIKLDVAGADIRMDYRNPSATYRLNFAPTQGARKGGPRYWKSTAELGKAPAGKPLAGMTIALDPGHIGGDFARMEERWFQIGNGKPVIEGEMVLIVANLLEPRLKALGAKVVNIRKNTRPVTSQRPRDLRREAADVLQRMGITKYPQTYSSMKDPLRSRSLQWQSEMLFFRTSEVRARADIINRKVQPDLTLCLHFNADAWGDPDRPTLVPNTHFHILVNGAYSQDELSLDDVRHAMLLRLLQGIHQQEIPVATDVARSMAAETGLPPFIYRGPNAVGISGTDYVWGRNLLAGRIFMNPVLFMEPYVMNSQLDYERIQAGDYEGTRVIGGVERRSIFREYADSLATGLAEHFSKARR